MLARLGQSRSHLSSTQPAMVFTSGIPLPVEDSIATASRLFRALMTRRRMVASAIAGFKQPVLEVVPNQQGY